ncbi:3'-5' exoribonuclease [Bacillus cereus]|uniref:exonuclease domain-containing protein n=1 Tax=Bacillus cereus TaxID=1396 RepID=UPI001927F7AD|nr:exonuclease domain-containing protein [Bacillus cereus]EKS7847366.1 3'-5' exoribonuclease [Bacillus wiedmannii]MBL3890734.1 3'-5' exoribonuclease [Bacillus cereus]
MHNFVAFDFETANHHRHSICAVGMVFVENGEIIDTLYELINPEEDFDYYNIAIHGITPNDVKDALTFPEFYEAYKKRFENKLLVAHYLPFDGYALRDSLRRYELPSVYNNLLCTYQLSKKLITGEKSYTLKYLCKHFNIELNNHHNALEDARACAQLMLQLSHKYDLPNIEEIYSKTHIRTGEISGNTYRSSLVQSQSYSSLNLKDINVATEVSEDHPFYQKHIVFTGKLNAYTRIEAAQLIANKGGIPQNGINKSTNYIIIGDFDNVMIKGNKSSKLEKAEKLIAQGKELEIISEEEFMRML